MKRLYSKYLPEYRSFEGKANELSGWIDEYAYDELWGPPKTLKDLSASRLSPSIRNESLRFGFHYPASLTLADCFVPAFFINHHMCHASSSYYQSGFRVAAIFSQDGGSGLGYDSGMFYYGEENRLYPIAPHHSILGILYDLVAFYMNLGESSAGKLMGLSAYGKPAFYDRKFLGNKNDLVNLTKETEPANIIEQWLYHCLSLAKDMGYDLEPFGDIARMTAPVNADIAASTQKLFEENVPDRS
jgi:carbamoyltransferase